MKKYKALWVVQRDSKWGVIDDKGNVIIPIEFDSEIYQSHEDYEYSGHVLFNVKKDGKYGLYKLGKGQVLACKYDQIYEISYSRWEEVICEVIEDGKIKLMDENFEEIQGMDIYESPARGYYIEKIDSAYKLYAVTKNGVELVAGRTIDEYKVADTYNSFVELKINGLWGVFDVAHFTWIYEPVFEEIVWGGIDHFWAVKRDGKYGFVAANGCDLSDFSIVDRSEVEKSLVVRSLEGSYPKYEKPFNGRRMNANETYILGEKVNTSPFRRYWPQK